jgi:4'-phosphopantetheinyl transferase
MRITVLAGRWLARFAAALVSGLDPKQITVSRRCPGCGGLDHGRPIADPGPVWLSASRRRGLVAAIAGDSPVAVDVEPMSAQSEVPSTLLTPGDRAVASPEGRLRLWTRKECLVKLGMCSLDDFG